MNRWTPLIFLGSVVATFGVIWGMVEAADYFGVQWFREAGPVGLLLLFSIALNAAVAVRWIARAAAPQGETTDGPDPGLDDGDPYETPSVRTLYPEVAELASRLGDARIVEVLVAGGDSFYTHLSQALEMDEAFPLGMRPELRVLLRRSSRASKRSYHLLKRLEQRFDMSVEVRWYDWDFMLRGFCFDRKLAYLSFFLREDDRMAGRINGFVTVGAGAGDPDEFLLAMFCRTFDAYFHRPDAVERDSTDAFFQED